LKKTHKLAQIIFLPSGFIKVQFPLAFKLTEINVIC